MFCRTCKLCLYINYVSRTRGISVKGNRPIQILWAIYIYIYVYIYILSPLSFQRNSLILLHGHLRGFGMSWLVYTLSKQCGIYKLYILCRLYKVYKLYKLYRLSKAYRLYNLSSLYMLYLKLLGLVGYISYSSCTV